MLFLNKQEVEKQIDWVAMRDKTLGVALGRDTNFIA